MVGPRLRKAERSREFSLLVDPTISIVICDSTAESIPLFPKKHDENALDTIRQWGSNMQPGIWVQLEASTWWYLFEDVLPLFWSFFSRPLAPILTPWWPRQQKETMHMVNSAWMFQDLPPVEIDLHGIVCPYQKSLTLWSHMCLLDVMLMSHALQGWNQFPNEWLVLTIELSSVGKAAFQVWVV
jgi:hypothetical protein